MGLFRKKNKTPKINSLDLTHPEPIHKKQGACHCLCGNISKSFVRLTGRQGGGRICMGCYQKKMKGV